jgi:hypothetical protein
MQEGDDVTVSGASWSWSLSVSRMEARWLLAAGCCAWVLQTAALWDCNHIHGPTVEFLGKPGINCSSPQPQYKASASTRELASLVSEGRQGWSCHVEIRQRQHAPQTVSWGQAARSSGGVSMSTEPKPAWLGGSGRKPQSLLCASSEGSS